MTKIIPNHQRAGYGLCGCQAPDKLGHEHGCRWQLDQRTNRIAALERRVEALETRLRVPTPRRGQ